MIIDCIGCLHGHYPEMEGGDLLIITGDLTATDKIKEWDAFYKWVKDQPYRQKVMIAGNHDGFLEQCLSSKECRDLLGDEEEIHIEYLRDSGMEFEGLKIWGSPWTPKFGNWHFMLPRGKALKEKWDLIPADTDILITHGPPYGILDKTINDEHVGCNDLKNAVLSIQPKYHIFSHIHEGYGHFDTTLTKFINCSHMDVHYNPVNKPFRVYL